MRKRLNRVGATLNGDHARNGEVQDRLNELADLADCCRIVFLKITEMGHWRPPNGSPAAKVAATLEHIDPGGFTLVSEVVVTYLEIAAAHFGGLAALYRSGEAMFPPIPLARSVVELISHVIWVIGKPTDAAKDLLARAYLAEFNSRESAKQSAGRMGSKEAEPHQRAKQEWIEFRNRVIATFPETTADNLGGNPVGRMIAGQKVPPARRLC